MTKLVFVCIIYVNFNFHSWSWPVRIILEILRQILKPTQCYHSVIVPRHRKMIKLTHSISLNKAQANNCPLHRQIHWQYKHIRVKNAMHMWMNTWQVDMTWTLLLLAQVWLVGAVLQWYSPDVSSWHCMTAAYNHFNPNHTIHAKLAYSAYKSIKLAHRTCWNHLLSSTNEKR